MRFVKLLRLTLLAALSEAAMVKRSMQPRDIAHVDSISELPDGVYHFEYPEGPDGPIRVLMVSHAHDYRDAEDWALPPPPERPREPTALSPSPSTLMQAITETPSQPVQPQTAETSSATTGTIVVETLTETVTTTTSKTRTALWTTVTLSDGTETSALSPQQATPVTATATATATETAYKTVSFDRENIPLRAHETEVPEVAAGTCGGPKRDAASCGGGSAAVDKPLPRDEGNDEDKEVPGQEESVTAPDGSNNTTTDGANHKLKHTTEDKHKHKHKGPGRELPYPPPLANPLNKNTRLMEKRGGTKKKEDGEDWETFDIDFDEPDKKRKKKKKKPKGSNGADDGKKKEEDHTNRKFPSGGKIASDELTETLDDWSDPVQDVDFGVAGVGGKPSYGKPPKDDSEDLDHDLETEAHPDPTDPDPDEEPMDLPPEPPHSYVIPVVRWECHPENTVADPADFTRAARALSDECQRNPMSLHMQFEGPRMAIVASAAFIECNKVYSMRVPCRPHEIMEAAWRLATETCKDDRYAAGWMYASDWRKGWVRTKSEIAHNKPCVKEIYPG